MFNFGWGEILLIGIVALIAIGPKELPTVLRSVGQLLAKVRRMANEFQGQFQEAIREADIADLKKQAEDMTSSVTSSVNEISSFDPMAETQKELDKTFTLQDPMADPVAELPAPVDGVTDGATLPQGVLPSVETPLPQIDVPLPDAPQPLTEKDFAVTETPAEAPTPAAAPMSDEPIKQAGVKA